MAKAPAFQFYVRDWLSDLELRQASATSRGIWIDLLCYIWMSSNCDGTLKVTPRGLARLCCGGDLLEALHFLNNVWDLGFADLKFEEEVPYPITEKFSNTKITIINRRMRADYLQKISGKERSAKFRAKGGGDPDKWVSIRVKILKRDEYMCAYCGRKADTVDHVIPKSKGGDESDENLAACCKRCNMKKQNRTPKEAGMKFWKGYLKIKHQNNINNNTKITPPSSTTSSSSKKEIDKKDIFGEFKNVFLLKDELEKLNKKFKSYTTRQKIENLSIYIESTGKKYKSHYATILAWDRRNKEKEQKKHTLESPKEKSPDWIENLPFDQKKELDELTKGIG